MNISETTMKEMEWMTNGDFEMRSEYGDQLLTVGLDDDTSSVTLSMDGDERTYWAPLTIKQLNGLIRALVTMREIARRREQS